MSVKLADLLDLEDGEGVEVASSPAPRPLSRWAGEGWGEHQGGGRFGGEAWTVPGLLEIFVGEPGISPMRGRFWS